MKPAGPVIVYGVNKDDRIMIRTTPEKYLKELEKLGQLWDDNQLYVRPALLSEEETTYGGF